MTSWQVWNANWIVEDEATRRAVSAEVMAWTQGLLAKALGVAIAAG